MDNPYIVEETEDYAVVFKPAKMHSVPEREDLTLRHGDTEEELTILEWHYQNNYFNKEIRLMHRLDYETHGLVLFAKNEKSFFFFKDLQDNGEFIKEYSAICSPHPSLLTPHSLEGFPDNSSVSPCLRVNSSVNNPSVIESYFRPFGPGRKQVRPVIDDEKKHKEIAKDKGGFYRTEIIEKNDNVFTVRIKRGFRHQIRCHLCWTGFPILNDPLYNSADVQPEALLALRSHALFFTDPASREKKECRIEQLK